MATIAPFGLRMQADLKARVEAAAEANGRSMNAEIVARLESTFRGSPFEEPISSDVIKQLLVMHNNQILRASEGSSEIEFQDTLKNIKNDLYFIKAHLMSLHGQEDIAKILPGENLKGLEDYIETIPEPRPSRADALRYIIKRGLEVLMGEKEQNRKRVSWP